MAIAFRTEPLIPRDQRSSLDISNLGQRLRSQGGSIAADALSAIQGSIHYLENKLRDAGKNEFDELFIKDPTGALIGWIGSQPPYFGAWFKQLYVGGSGPDTAPFFADEDGNVIIGKNGSLSVQDLDENEVGWIGVEVDVTKNITGATNATPIVITSNSHGYANGDTVFIASVGGNTAANGYRIVKNRTNNTFEITNLAGTNVAGNGSYTSGGTSTRYYGGAWYQTFAVGGTGFSDAKLVARANGDLDITDALITLNGSGATIVLDPAAGEIVIEEAPSGTRRTTIDGGGMVFDDYVNPSTSASLTMYNTLIDMDGLSVGRVKFEPGTALIEQSALGASSYLYLARGASTSGRGPAMKFWQSGGTVLSPGQTLSGDSIGEVRFEGWPSSGSGVDSARIAVLAAENFTSGAQGTSLVIETTPTGSTSKAEAVRILGSGFVGILTSPSYELDVNGEVNADGYRVGGTAGIDRGPGNLTTISGVTTTGLQYKDHAGVNQTQTVVTAVTFSNASYTFSKGLLTA